MHQLPEEDSYLLAAEWFPAMAHRCYRPRRNKARTTRIEGAGGARRSAWGTSLARSPAMANETALSVANCDIACRVCLMDQDTRRCRHLCMPNGPLDISAQALSFSGFLSLSHFQ